jgi:hypothetical protein
VGRRNRRCLTDVVVVRLGREEGDVPWPEVLRDVADRVAAG